MKCCFISVNIRSPCCRSDIAWNITITWEYQHPYDVNNIIVIVNSVIIWWCKSRWFSHLCIILMVPYAGDREAENICPFLRRPDDLLARCQYPYSADRDTFWWFCSHWRLWHKMHYLFVLWIACFFCENHELWRLTLGSNSNIIFQPTTQSIELPFLLMN